MSNERFDAAVRRLGARATRRGALGVLVGLAGLGLSEALGKGRKPRGRRRGGAGRVAAEALVQIKVGCPKNPAASIALLSAYYPGYWWDHTDLTVAVQAHPNADPELLAAVREAIAIWNGVLAADRDLRIVTLTDVTGALEPEHKADIVLHYVPHAGGTVFGGYAICGDHKCNNVLVRSDLPKPLDRDPYSAEYLGWVTLHELGHALGLGHAEPLEENTDLMGYGWPDLGDPVLSECDLRALKVVFAWAIEGAAPYPPSVAEVSCRGLCRVR